MADPRRARQRAAQPTPAEQDQARDLMERGRAIRHAAGVGFRAMAAEVGCNRSTLSLLETAPPAVIGLDPYGYRQRWCAILAVLDAGALPPAQ